MVSQKQGSAFDGLTPLFSENVPGVKGGGQGLRARGNQYYQGVNINNNQPSISSLIKFMR